MRPRTIAFGLLILVGALFAAGGVVYGTRLTEQGATQGYQRSGPASIGPISLTCKEKGPCSGYFLLKDSSRIYRLAGQDFSPPLTLADLETFIGGDVTLVYRTDRTTHVDITVVDIPISGDAYTVVQIGPAGRGDSAAHATAEYQQFTANRWAIGLPATLGGLVLVAVGLLFLFRTRRGPSSTVTTASVPVTTPSVPVAQLDAGLDPPSHGA